MFLPIGDHPNPPRFRPWVNWTLIAINVAVFLLVNVPMGAAYGEFVTEWGFKPGAPTIEDLFASMFLHGGFAHLAGNMLFLWIYGDNIEHRLGRVGYLLFYLLSGVAASGFYAAFMLDSLIPCVGASGAISGVLGAYFVLYPRNQIKVLMALPPFFWDVWHIRAFYVLGMYLVVDNLLPFFVGAGGSVAYGAHIGGFIAGVALGWMSLRRRGRDDYAQDGAYLYDSGDDRSDTAAYNLDRDLDRASRLIQSGDLQTAYDLLADWLEYDIPAQEKARVHLAIAELLLVSDQEDEAMGHLQTAMETGPPPVQQAAMQIMDEVY